MMMLKARNGDLIKCPNGHLVGSFIRDVPEDRKIEADDLKLSYKGLMDPGHGYECPECKEPVATFSLDNAVWRVRSVLGWIS
jgi:hypothetical protein